MKYTFSMLGEDADSRREKIVLESRSSESPRHIVLKILAYLLFRDTTGGLPLRVEPGEIGHRHRPDLLASDSVTDAPLLWIDCGQIETKRLGRIASTNRDCRVVVVKQTGREARLYAEAAKKELPVLGVGAARFVAYLGFDDGFTASAIANLRGANTVCVTRTGADGFAATWNDAAISTTLQAFDAQGAPLALADFWGATTIAPT